ncbi:Pycsar system effector family protein [Streptomyces gardneri]|uniref:Pycsar system effector family protein n=1 Tax=Streptomyces gardneri TaxID=66892 RepID=UPI0011439195|nr:Pycsar system effector family protein [Streptomyces gardneri]
METREELVKADQKANLLLAAMGVAVAALVGAFASAKVNPICFPVLGQVLFWIGCALAILALGAFARAVFPNLGSGEAGRMHYFGDVVENDASVSVVVDLVSRVNIAHRDIQQFTVLAKSVLDKYKNIRRGIVCAVIAVPLLFAGSLLGVVLD